MKLLKSFAINRATPICMLLAMVSASRATIPEPENVIYGNITLDSTLITAARADVVIEARRTTNGPAIASYRMGSDPAVGNFYSLRLLLESVPPVSNTNASQISQSVIIVVTDGTGLRAQASYVIADRGVAQRVDFGAAAVDSDGDGLPDAWELQHFANLSQFPGSIAPNGLSVLQNFIAGTDPNDLDGGFRLQIGRTNNQKHVSFFALRAEGPGYDGMTRLYTLEANPSFTAGAWSSVPSYVDIAGNNQTVDYLSAGPGAPGFFRGKVSLQGFTVPGADSDVDGLPDAWESLHFGNLNQSASSINANGQTALQNFVAGTDPNNAGSKFQLTVTRSGADKMISFFAVSAQGAGYEGRQRFYSLETSADATGPWTSVAGFSNVLGNNQTLIHHSLGTTSRAFFRGKVWLQP